jgi:hypothetical protein
MGQNNQHEGGDCVEAKDVTPELVDNYKDNYVILSIQAVMFMDEMEKAINIFASKGWRCVNITMDSRDGTFTLMER